MRTLRRKYNERWSEYETRRIIEARIKHDNLFANKLVKARRAWETVGDEAGVKYNNWQRLRKKWANLIFIYKQTVEESHSSSPAQMDTIWSHFGILHDFFLPKQNRCIPLIVCNEPDELSRSTPCHSIQAESPKSQTNTLSPPPKIRKLPKSRDEATEEPLSPTLFIKCEPVELSRYLSEEDSNMDVAVPVKPRPSTTAKIRKLRRPVGETQEELYVKSPIVIYSEQEKPSESVKMPSKRDFVEKNSRLGASLPESTKSLSAKCLPPPKILKLHKIVPEENICPNICSEVTIMTEPSESSPSAPCSSSSQSVVVKKAAKVRDKDFPEQEKPSESVKMRYSSKRDFVEKNSRLGASLPESTKLPSAKCSPPAKLLKLHKIVPEENIFPNICSEGTINTEPSESSPSAPCSSSSQSVVVKKAAKVRDKNFARISKEQSTTHSSSGRRNRLKNARADAGKIKQDKLEEEELKTLKSIQRAANVFVKLMSVQFGIEPDPDSD